VRAWWSGGALKLPQRVRAEPGHQTVFGEFYGKSRACSSNGLEEVYKKCQYMIEQKRAIPVHYLVRLSQHTIYCGMGPKAPRVSLLLWLELKLVHFMCKMWHLVRPILLTITRKFWPSVVHSTDTETQPTSFHKTAHRSSVQRTHITPVFTWCT